MKTVRGRCRLLDGCPDSKRLARFFLPSAWASNRLARRRFLCLLARNRQQHFTLPPAFGLYWKPRTKPRHWHKIYSARRDSRRLSQTTPEFLRGHPVTYERSSVYRNHRHANSGICRACVEAGYSFLKFLAAYDFHRLAVGASNASSPLTGSSLKCLYDKSLVLHSDTNEIFEGIQMEQQDETRQ